MFSELYIVHFNHFSIPRCGDQCTRWCSNYDDDVCSPY